MSKSYPKQKDTIRKKREAVAPYNFVELPDQVVPAEALADHNCYDSERHTGYITCTLVAETPLYIRTGLSPEEFAEIATKPFHEMSEEQKKRYAQFFALNGLPAIPGSSLRGMFRTLVEIATYSKVTRVTGRQPFFFRAVAAEKSDPLAVPYKQELRKVKAGYLIEQKGKWYIQPATTLNNQTYLWVSQRVALAGCSVLKSFDQADYRPQYIHVSFNEASVKNNRLFVKEVQDNDSGNHQGVLVTSGSMQETGSDENSPRRNHCIVLSIDQDAQRLEIDEQAVQDYRNGLTDFQKECFSEDWGFIQHNRPVFYVPPKEDEPVVYFGQSPNFRIPYRYAGSKKASSPRDFVPRDLRDSTITDLAEAMFGYVPTDDGERNDTRQAYAGRVFFDDAPLLLDKVVPLSDKEYITPHILASPKPTTFQHYLVQKQEEREQLRHYASTPETDTVIRGHKLYWHQGQEPRLTRDAWLARIQAEDDKVKKAPKQYTGMQPLAPDNAFTVTIRFENLSDVELGVLLWLVQKASDSQYRLKLGMGKPLGMGSVRLEEARVVCSQRVQRYRTLFDTAGEWETGEATMDEQEQERCIAAFQDYVLQQIGKQGQSFDDLRRINMLLVLLRWPGPSQDRTRYMEIERDAQQGYVSRKPRKDEKVNEYADRPVLPDPWQVLGENPPEYHPLASEPDSQEPQPDEERKVIDTRKFGVVETEATDTRPGEIVDDDEGKSYLYERGDVVGEFPGTGQGVRFHATKRKIDSVQGRRRRQRKVNWATDIEPYG